MEYIPEWLKDMGGGQEPFGLAKYELDQAAETGHDVTALRTRFASLRRTDVPELMALYRDVLALPRTRQWPYFEESDLDAIVAALPVDDADHRPVTDVADRLRGAWHGRVIGNMVGKPVEAAVPEQT